LSRNAPQSSLARRPEAHSKIRGAFSCATL
jgi:hypothetical protein